MKILKYFGFIIIILMILIVIYALYLILNYQINKNKYIEVAEVQGTENGYVPQGLAYSEKYDVILQTSYSSNNDNSMLFVIDFKSGRCIKALKLNKSNGKKNTSHAGGIATNDELVWITSNYEINKYNLDEIISTNNNYINSLEDIKIKNRGDFCTYDNGILWIGEFAISTLFTNTKPQLYGFEIASNENYQSPKYNYFLPSKVQGMAVTDDGKFIFSRSYTGFIQSKLSIYDKEKKLSNKTIPSMSEGIFIKDNEIYVLFESATDDYTIVYPKIRNIIKINL